MAWTNIPNANLAAGAPIRSVDLLALRDNIPAVANGDSGAPKVQTNGINDSAVTTAKLATNERMNTTNVLGSTAGASVGAVGTYAYCAKVTSGSVSAGSTISGSSLRYGGLGRDANEGAFENQYSGTPAGTWRAMGYAISTNFSTYSGTVWLRIS
jgi:hypothetical protein